MIALLTINDSSNNDNMNDRDNTNNSDSVYGLFANSSC